MMENKLQRFAGHFNVPYLKSGFSRTLLTTTTTSRPQLTMRLLLIARSLEIEKKNQLII